MGTAILIIVAVIGIVTIAAVSLVILLFWSLGEADEIDFSEDETEE